MKSYIKKMEVRWADLDPNFHMLHSKYYDLAGYCRMSFLVENGLTPSFMKLHHFGPIIFREECIFKREISFGDELSINITLKSIDHDFSKWTMCHEVWKNGDTLAAMMTCDGAWMDTITRKLTIPPKEVIGVFENAPKADGFFIHHKDNK